MIRNRSINLNLLVSFFALCIGYVLIDLRLFYAIFVLKIPLNQDIFTGQPLETINIWGNFLVDFVEYWTGGYYQAASMQKKIIFPFSFIVSFFLLVKIYIPIKNTDGVLSIKIKKIFRQMDKKTKNLLLLEFLIFSSSVIAALYNLESLNGFIKRSSGLFPGFNWSRVWVFNRVFWYIILGLCIDIVCCEIKKLSFILSDNIPEKTFVLPGFVLFLFVFFINFFQIGYIISKKVYYNDVRNTWAHMLHIALDIDDTSSNYISYDEYFAKDFFEKIKRDIYYTDEKVVVSGYSSSIFVYNGFNCIGKYNFLEPTRNQYMEPIIFDTDSFKDQFDYILSKAEIINSDDLGLNLIKKYRDDKDIYIIYLYKSNVKQITEVRVP
jgi:hypothetical protein